MIFTPREKLPHEPPSWVKAGALYFCTLCVQPRGADLLTRAEVGGILLSAAEHYHLTLRWHARLFLLMPDHVHALVAFPSSGAMASCWRDWKRYTAKTPGVCWQRDFFDHRIRNDDSWELKADYIRQNPVRNGLVARAADWPWVFAGE
jgi:REP element-mobilizing transposase RayT